MFKYTYFLEERLKYIEIWIYKRPSILDIDKKKKKEKPRSVRIL